MPIVPTIPKTHLAASDHARAAAELGGLASPPSVHPGIAHQRRPTQGRPTQGRPTQGRLTPDERKTLTTKASALHVAQVRH